MSDEAALVRAWVGGDASAGERITARHYASMRRFFDLRVPEVSEDLTQRTFLACAERVSAFRGEAPFVGFLFGIARNQLAMYLRRRGTSERLMSFASSDASDTVTTPTGLIARREEHGLILRAFEQLSDDKQIVIELFYWEGMSVAEIGAVLRLNVSAVTSRLSRARASMRDFLQSLELRETARRSVLSDMDGWARSLRE